MQTLQGLYTDTGDSRAIMPAHDLNPVGNSFEHVCMTYCVFMCSEREATLRIINCKSVEITH
jgi:hypothetical protein